MFRQSWLRSGLLALVIIQLANGLLSEPGPSAASVFQTARQAAPQRPQTPKAPFPYQEREVTYTNAADKTTLAGTLTVPAGKGPHPAVLLLPGSGPVDRNETMLPGHKPFMVIADHLTRRGIAVLRTDDRGVGESGGDYLKA